MSPATAVAIQRPSIALSLSHRRTCGLESPSNVVWSASLFEFTLAPSNVTLPAMDAIPCCPAARTRQKPCKMSIICHSSRLWHEILSRLDGILNPRYPFSFRLALHIGKNAIPSKGLHPNENYSSHPQIRVERDYDFSCSSHPRFVKSRRNKNWHLKLKQTLRFLHVYGANVATDLLVSTVTITSKIGH